MKKGLKTKLEFRFGADDSGMPDLNFVVPNPPEKKKAEIRIIKKKKKSKKKNSELF